MMKRLILPLLFGGFIGFLISSGADAKNFTLSLYEIAYELGIVFTVLSFVLVAVALIYTMRLRKLARVEVVGDAEDEQEETLYKLYSDITLATTVALVIGLVAFSVVAVTEQSIVLNGAASVSVIVAAFMNFRTPKLVKYVYPERKFPAVLDKDYAKKLFAMSDEGERHTMLSGLYSAFTIGNTMLLISMIICSLYSVWSGESQLFSIVVIALILIVMNTQYMLKVRNR